MGSEARQDLSIAGSASAPGGIYKDARISGAGKITGDVDCVRLEVSGAATISGNVKAQSARIMGAGKIEGNLESDEIKASGSLDVQGDVSTKELEVNGSTTVKGSITAESVEVRGALRAGGDCSAESFTSRGCFTIGGLLNAGRIEVFLHGNSQAKEIGGEAISVKHGDDAFFGLHKILHALINHTDGLTADSIEGDDVHLDGTRAKVVRGNNVTVGPGCKIDLVEYKGSFDQDKEATVTEHHKV